MANRNGFYYVLDRKTGEFLLGTQYAKQTWAEGLDERGRPIVIPGMEPSEKGTLVYPSLQGSTNWSSPSYSPTTGMLYVPVREMGSIYFKTAVEYKPGHLLHRRQREAARRRIVGRGARARRRRPASRRGTSSCRRRRGPASCRPPAGSCSADRTKATSSRSTRRPASRCGSSRPAARSDPARCRFCPTASSTSPSPAATRLFVFGID